MKVKPTTYNQEILAIDEQLCALLKQRKEVSNNKAGIPSSENISIFAERYGLYEDHLNSLFSMVSHEEFYRPTVDPSNFKRYIPVMKSIHIDEKIYSLTFIRQFENASLVHLDIDWHETIDPIDSLKRDREQRRFLNLTIGEDYDCRCIGGSGSSGHMTEKFVVSPPLPDNTEGLSLVFTQYEDYFLEKPTGIHFVFDIDSFN